MPMPRRRQRRSFVEQRLLLGGFREDPHLLLLSDFAAIGITGAGFYPAAFYVFKSSGTASDDRAFSSHEGWSERRRSSDQAGIVGAAQFALPIRGQTAAVL